MMATAEQTVGAVLDATNKRYLVEHTEGTSGNGTWWCDRYSDGWVEQGGYGIGNSTSYTQIVFPTEFADTNYYENYIGERPGTNPYNDVYLHTVQDKTTTGFTIRDYMVTGQPTAWEAKGFAA